MDSRGARVRAVGAGPLKTVGLEAVHGDPTEKFWRDARNLVENIGGRFVVPSESEFSPDVARHFPIRPRLARRAQRRAHALNAALAVRERAVLLEEARSGQYEVRAARRLGEKQLLHDEQVETLERLQHVRFIGIALCEVFALNPECTHAPLRSSLQHLRNREPRMHGWFDSPRRCEARSHRWIRNGLITR